MWPLSTATARPSRKWASRSRPIGTRIFLACKTLERSAKGAQVELEQSLRHLRTDHFDLYQFHSVSDVDEVDEIFAPRRRHGNLPAGP